MSKFRMRWAGYVARMGEKRNKYTFLVRKLQGNKTTRKIILKGI
jgi:hypothetical protein